MTRTMLNVFLAMMFLCGVMFGMSVGSYITKKELQAGECKQ